jgi:hypothetical protein
MRARTRGWALAALVATVLAALGALWLWRAGTGPLAEAVDPAAFDAGAGLQGAGASRSREPRPAASVSARDGGPGADPEQWARLGWGEGPDQAGRARPQEANPEGPMSLTADRQGNVLLLDQVNGRLLRLDRDGAPSGTIALPVRAAQDVQVGPGGEVVVLDRLGDRTVAILSPEGVIQGELPVEGTGIPEGGAVSGLFLDGDEVYLERAHGPLVRVGNLAGISDPQRAEVPGRPSRDGTMYVSAGIIDAPAGRAYVAAVERESHTQRFTRELRLGAPILTLLGLDTDRSGIVYLAALVITAPEPEPTRVVRLVCLDPRDGAPLGSRDLPASELPEETFRQLTVLDEGGVLYAHKTEEGLTLLRADCR